MLRITNGFNKLSDPDLETRAQSILTSMTSNPNFVNPDPTLQVFTDAITAFRTALAAAKEGGRLAVAVKQEKRNELINVLHALGNCILYLSKGDRVKAVSSGFTIARQPEPAPAITKPENMRLADGLNSGELKVQISKVTSARSYIYECTPDPLTDNSNWESQTSTLIKNTFKNLDSGKRYWFRVAALGINEQMVYSDAASRIVQ